MGPRNLENQKSVGTVLRVVRLLQCVAETRDDVSVRQLSSMLELPASTVHRLLQVLALDDLIERDPETHRYRAGLELVRMGRLIASRSDITQLAAPYMRAVVEQCNEACLLVRYLPAAHQVFVMSGVNSNNPLRYDIELYTQHSVLWGATGRSVLAFLPKDQLDAALRRKDPSPATGEPVPSRAALNQELGLIRKRGYALSHGQKIKGAVGIGAPLFDRSDKVVGSLCITLPEMRFSPEAGAAMSETLKSQAQKLSRDLGYVGSLP